MSFKEAWKGNVSKDNDWNLVCATKGGGEARYSTVFKKNLDMLLNCQGIDGFGFGG